MCIIVEINVMKQKLIEVHGKIWTTDIIILVVGICF